MLRRKIAFYWIALITSAAAMAMLAFWLIDREERRKQSDTERAKQNLLESSNELLNRLWSELRFETSKQLVSFHEEGLAKSLERWKNNNPLIDAVFIRDREKRSIESGHPFHEYVDAFQSELVQDSDELVRISLSDPSQGSIYQSGYYAENVEIASYGGRKVDPVLLWSHLSVENEERWIVAHQLHSDLTLRGALIDNDYLQSLANNLLSGQQNSSYQLRLIDGREYEKTKNAATRRALNAINSHWLLTIEELPIENRWASIENFAFWLVVLCLALIVICGSLLISYANREYTQALRKSTFVSQVSHELKTPLTSISLHADLLESSNLSGEKRLKFSTVIAQECSRLTRMIDNLLSLSSLENDKIMIHPQAFDVCECIQEIIAELKPTARQSGIDIEFETREANITADADPDLFRQSLINLIDNGMKYAASGKTISIEAEKGNGVLQVMVSDSGPGIPNSIRKKIFEPFFQEKSDLNNKNSGVGLGLSISRQALQQMGGDLVLNSNYTQGAQFIIKLPVK